MSAFPSYATVFPSASGDKDLTWLFLNNTCSQQTRNSYIFTKLSIQKGDSLFVKEH